MKLWSFGKSYCTVAIAILSLSAVSVLADIAAPSKPPAFNHLCNNGRTGVTATEFRPPYQLAWTHGFAHKPRPAWREPAWEMQRIDMDYAYPIAADGKSVYVASSSDHAIHALDLKSGETRWRFFTEGPIRVPPMTQKGRVYFSSDDGCAYCVDGTSGDLVWKYRPEIPDLRMLGNEQMINRWPARSGVLVDGNRAYTTIGMWSTEGIVIACLNSETGHVIWENDSSGTRYMTQPHFEAMGGVSPQGPLALCGDVLVVPCGRAAPAFFDASSGQLLYNEAEGLFPGGAWVMTHGNLAFTPCEYLQKPNPVDPESLDGEMSDEASLVALEARTGEEVFHLHGALRGVIDEHGMMSLIGPGRLVGVALQDVLKAAPNGYQAKRGSSEGHFVEVDEYKLWETSVKKVFELIQAGSTLIAGGRQTLACYDATDGRELWRTKIQGDVRDLLIVDEALLVSTSEGEIHCFRTDRSGVVAVVREVAKETVAADATQKHIASLLAAGEIKNGYGLLLGNVSCDYLTSLSQQSSLTWYWGTDSSETPTARAQLAEAGIYGPRITIHNVSLDVLPYADYAANLLVWELESTEQLQQTPASEIYRVLRPGGGRAVIACRKTLKPAVRRWIAAGNRTDLTQEDFAEGVCLQRAALPGAGAWTHQYANAGKSGSSEDQLVRLPLKVLWFGGVGPADIVSRHYRAPAPLAINGRMFVAGRNNLHAMDAYNGHVLWQRDMPGVGRWPAAYRGGCMAADQSAIYVLDNRTCLRLDPQTGATQLTYQLPSITVPDVGSLSDDPFIWEYLAVGDSVVVGTIGQANVKRSWWSMAHPANQVLFVLDKATGRRLWTYNARSAIDSSAIAIEGQRLFLIDGLASAEVFPRGPRRGEPTTKRQQKPVIELAGASHTRELKAIDLLSGTVVWTTTDIDPRQNSLCASNGVIVATTPIWHGLRAKQEGSGVSAFSTEDGKLLWTREKTAPPPVIVGDAVYLPEAHNLHTGQPLLREDPLTGQLRPYAASVTGGCGQMAGCEHMLMKRSGSMGFFDLSDRSGVYHFPNMRASCWVNMVPACGLVLVPEGSSSCPCSYNYKTSIAMMPATRHNHWGLYTNSPRPDTLQVKQLRLNLGAPGDRQDGTDAKDIWLAYPRPSTVGPRGAGGMGIVPYDRLPNVTSDPAAVGTPILRNPDWLSMDDTDRPWLYCCGLVGPLKLNVRVAPDNAPLSRYRVTLHFCELNTSTTERTCDVRLQGDKVLTHASPAPAPGGSRRPLAMQFTVEASERIALEILPLGAESPVISGIQIVQLSSE